MGKFSFVALVAIVLVVVAAVVFTAFGPDVYAAGHLFEIKQNQAHLELLTGFSTGSLNATDIQGQGLDNSDVLMWCSMRHAPEYGKMAPSCEKAFASQ